MGLLHRTQIGSDSLEVLGLQFEYTSPQSPIEEFFGGHMCVNAFGNIEPGDEQKFQKFLEANQVPPRTSVYINSNGGHVETAIEIGRQIRGDWMSTHIGQYFLVPNEGNGFVVPRKFKPGVCRSAATLVYLGGRLRFWNEGSKFGVHRFSYRNPSPDHVEQSQVLSAKIAEYLDEMGISPKFLATSSAVPSNQIHDIKKKKLEKLGVMTGGQTPVVWTIEAANGAIYVRGESDCIFGHQKVMLGYKHPDGFYFHAVIESVGRERELCEFGVVEIVVDGENERIDISKRCYRSVVGIYTNIIVGLTVEEASKLAYSESFGVQVRATNEAEFFFGIAALPTADGANHLKTVFETAAAGR